MSSDISKLTKDELSKKILSVYRTDKALGFKKGLAKGLSDGRNEGVEACVVALTNDSLDAVCNNEIEKARVLYAIAYRLEELKK